MFTNENLVMIFLAMLVLIFFLKGGMFQDSESVGGRAWRRRKVPLRRKWAPASANVWRSLAVASVAPGEGHGPRETFRMARTAGLSRNPNRRKYQQMQAKRIARHAQSTRRARKSR